MESQKRREGGYKIFSTNITFIDYGILALGISELVSKLKVPSIWDGWFTGMVFRTACVCSDESGNFGYRLVSGIVVHVFGMCSRSYDRNGTYAEQNQTFRKIDCHHNTYAVTGNIFVVSLVFGVLVFYLSDILVYLAFILEESRWRLRRRRHYRSSESLTQKDRLPDTDSDGTAGWYYGMYCVLYDDNCNRCGNLSSGELPTYNDCLGCDPSVNNERWQDFCRNAIEKENRMHFNDGYLNRDDFSDIGCWLFNHFVIPNVLNFMLMEWLFGGIFQYGYRGEDWSRLCSSTSNPIFGNCDDYCDLESWNSLDYHFDLGAGMFTAIYIIVRAAG